ncbi:Coiled-coil domain-containing protein 6 [Taenia solium]|eukprot:TsM_000747700 transcript=TsM_000747700 gene=TsM_000747700
MVDSASELDLESDASSIDGHTGRCEQLQRQVELLQQQNRMLKTEVDQLTLRVKSLVEKNEQLRRNSVSILAQAEREEEYISNTLQRQISELKKDKESLVVKFEEEEERLINELNRKLMQLQKDKDKLERTLAKEQEAQVNKLKRRIERLESESEWKQQILEKLRRDKIELENALEQEQEALVNRLWKKMKKLEDEKRILQDKLESVSAPPSESPSVQNISAVAIGGANQAQHSTSIPMGFLQTSQHRHSAGGSLRGSLRIPTTDALGRGSFDSFESSGCQSDNAGQSPTHSGARGSLTSSISPRPPQSPMELDDASMPTGSLVRSDSSQSGSRSQRNSFQPSNTTVAELTTESTVAGAAYVARLREEVIRLRRIVAVTQAEQALRSNQERSAIDENARLRQLLEVEVDRTRALTRALSDSESSLEIEDERCYNNARRLAVSSNRLRTTSDGCPAFLAQGPFLGPGHVYAAAVFQGRNNSGRVCRECGQPLPPGKMPYHGGAVTPPPSSPSPGSFVKPSPHVRPPHSIRQSSASTAVTTTGCVTSTTNVPTRHSANTSEGEEEDEEEDDERSKTPPASMTD